MGEAAVNCMKKSEMRKAKMEVRGKVKVFIIVVYRSRGKGKERG
jgi:hypothetical protein